jgi:hypothetical protein
VRPLAGLSLAATLLGTVACQHPMAVSVRGEHDFVLVDGHEIGAGPAMVESGIGAVRITVRRGDAERVTEVPRDRVDAGLLAASVGAGACGLPLGAALGFAIANPALLTAPLSLFVFGDIGGATAPFQQPSWFTLPLVAIGASIGVTPLAYAMMAELPAPVVSVDAPGGAP